MLSDLSRELLRPPSLCQLSLKVQTYFIIVAWLSSNDYIEPLNHHLFDTNQAIMSVHSVTDL